MSHLPFGWSDAVDDNHVVAHFIGGTWDGKTYAIPDVKEWKVVSYPAGGYPEIQGVPKKLMYDLAVYSRILHFEEEAVYWFVRLERWND
jgi:hypothetical protein